VFGEVAVACERGYEFAMGSLAPVTIVWCSESLIEVPVMPVMLSVLLVADIGDAARVLVTDDGGWGPPALAAETSMFNVLETDFRSISWLCTYVERYQFSNNQ
jgi:hypothetical protein